MKCMYFSIKYRCSNILLKKKNKLHFNRLFCCNHTCYCAGMVSVTSASHYVTSASHYQSRSSMYIRGLIPRNWPRQLRFERVDDICLELQKNGEGLFLLVVLFITVS